MFHKILVALDTSTTGDVVFEEALTLAKQLQARLMLLHVLSPDEENSPTLPTFSSLGYYPILSDELMTNYHERWRHYEKQGMDLLQSRCATATAAGVATEVTQIPGSSGRSICDLARNWGSDLIILGRRGHSGLSEWMLGSVSNYVLHHAPCSVLTVQGLGVAPKAVPVAERAAVN